MSLDMATWTQGKKEFGYSKMLIKVNQHKNAGNVFLHRMGGVDQGYLTVVTGWTDHSQHEHPFWLFKEYKVVISCWLKILRTQGRTDSGGWLILAVQ